MQITTMAKAGSKKAANAAAKAETGVRAAVQNAAAKLKGNRSKVYSAD